MTSEDFVVRIRTSGARDGEIRVYSFADDQKRSGGNNNIDGPIQP